MDAAAKQREGFDKEGLKFLPRVDIIIIIRYVCHFEIYLDFVSINTPDAGRTTHPQRVRIVSGIKENFWTLTLKNGNRESFPVFS